MRTIETHTSIVGGGWVGAKHYGLKCMKSMHSLHWQKLFSHESGVSGWASEWTNERRGARMRGEQCGASEWESGASERASGGTSGPVLTSRFQVILSHCAPGCQSWHANRVLRWCSWFRMPMEAPRHWGHWIPRSTEAISSGSRAGSNRSRISRSRHFSEIWFGCARYN